MRKIAIVLLVLLGINYSSYGQIDESSNSEQYEFMTLVCKFDGRQIDNIYITKPNGEYEKIDIDNLKFKMLETSPILDLLSSYSKEGWLVQNSDMEIYDANYCFYYLLKRKINRKQ